MPWVLLYVLSAVAGLAVIAALSWWLFGHVLDLGRAVADAGRRISDASAALERAAVSGTAARGAPDTGQWETRWGTPARAGRAQVPGRREPGELP